MSWSFLRYLGNSKLVRQSYFWIFLVPIVAKLMEKGDTSLLVSGLDIGLSLPFSWVLMYVSAVFFALGTTIYLLFCPRVVQRYSGYSEFAALGEHFDRINDYVRGLSLECCDVLRDRIKDLASTTKCKDIENGGTSVLELGDKVYNIKNDQQKQVFWITYDFFDRKMRAASIACAVSYALGGVSLMVIFVENLIYVLSTLY